MKNQSINFRKITSPAESRMRTRTAIEQLEEVRRELEKQLEEIPDADDESVKRDQTPAQCT